MMSILRDRTLHLYDKLTHFKCQLLFQLLKKTCVALDVEEGTSAATLTSASGRDMSKGDCNPSKLNFE